MLRRIGKKILIGLIVIFILIFLIVKTPIGKKIIETTFQNIGKHTETIEDKD